MSSARFIFPTVQSRPDRELGWAVVAIKQPPPPPPPPPPPLGGLLTVNVVPLEVPPPGFGLNTVTAVVPEAAISEAGIAAVNRVKETNVVGRSAPCH